MSKSLGNTINLGASADEIRAAVKQVYTDPLHLKASRPRPRRGQRGLPLPGRLRYRQGSGVAEMKAHYRRGGLGDSVVKQRLEAVLQGMLAPIRARREELRARTRARYADAQGRHDEGA